MNRRSNNQIKETIKAEYGAMHKSKVNYLMISRALTTKYNPRLIIESIQEYNDDVKKKK